MQLGLQGPRKRNKAGPNVWYLLRNWRGVPKYTQRYLLFPESHRMIDGLVHSYSGGLTVRLTVSPMPTWSHWTKSMKFNRAFMLLVRPEVCPKLWSLIHQPSWHSSHSLPFHSSYLRLGFLSCLCQWLHKNWVSTSCFIYVCNMLPLSEMSLFNLNNVMSYRVKLWESILKF
jgi:hypothetical protein